MCILNLIHDKERKAQGVSDRKKQFKSDFFEEHHGFRGDGPYVENFARNHPSDFELYFARRREAALARKASARAARLERRRVFIEATATANALRDVRLVATAVSAASFALKAKVKNFARASPIASGAPRSPEAHVALQKERRNRKKASRVATAVIKQARKVAAIFAGRVIETGVGAVASLVVPAEEAILRKNYWPIEARPCQHDEISFQ